LYLTSLTVQTILFTNDTEQFVLEGRAIAKDAPEWIRKNPHAIRLRKEEKISFQLEKPKKTKLEELRIEATKRGLQFSDKATEGTLEEMINDFDKAKKDAKK